MTIICNKANRTLGLLKRNLSFCSEDVKLQAYKGLIRPILDYASAVWDPHQLYLQEQLESVQKRSARFIASNYNFEPGSMTKILQQLKLEPLKNRRKQNRLILLTKGLKNQAKIPTNFFEPPTRRTKNMHSSHFKIIYARTDIMKYSFIPNTIKDWNNLTPKVITSVMEAGDLAEKYSDVIRGCSF